MQGSLQVQQGVCVWGVQAQVAGAVGGVGEEQRPGGMQVQERGLKIDAAMVRG